MSNKIVAYEIIGDIGDPTILVQDAFGNICVSSDPEELLDFLLHSFSSSVATSALRVVWDLDRAVALLLSLLPEPVVASLTSPTHTAFYNSRKLFYIRSKLFAVSQSHEEASFYDLSQYFPDDPEPPSIQELQEKADLFMAMLSETGIPSPKKLTSPVAVAMASGLLNGYAGIPTIHDAPENNWDAYDMALQCTPREWVSNYQIGHWDKLWSVDLASAYPASAARLFNLQDCCFTKSDVMNDKAYYGVLVGKFTVYPDAPYAFCTPFLEDRGDGVQVNFVGTRENYTCLLDEVRMLYRYGLGEFHLDHGWFIHPYNGVHPRLPFQTMMSQFYRFRSRSPIASFFFKRVMNGIIGKLLETRKGRDGSVASYGDRYNPLYYSLITTDTRLRVFDFLFQYDVTKEELVHIGVDGIKLTRQIPLPTSVGMGQWRSTGSQPAIVLSPGAIITPDRKYKRTGYEEVVEQISKRPAAWKYGRDKDIDLRKLDLNQIRVFPELPRTGQDLLCNTYLSRPVAL